MKIGFLSDIHLDDAALVLPHVNVETVLIDFLKESSLHTLVISGDISSNWQDSIGICDLIQQETGIRVFAVPGNHDIWLNTKESLLALEKFKKHPSFLINQFVELNEEWSLYGGMGWYDYSFRLDGFNVDEVAMRKKDFWPDSSFIDLGESDISFFEKQLNIWENSFKNKPIKNIVFSQHFVPRREFLDFKEDRFQWNFCNAYIGSSRINDFFLKHPEIKTAPFGHSHTRFGSNHLDGIDFLCNPVGYFHEWKTDDFLSELKACLIVKNI